MWQKSDTTLKLFSDITVIFLLSIRVANDWSTSTPNNTSEMHTVQSSAFARLINTFLAALTVESAPAGDVTGVVIGQDGSSGRYAGQLHSLTWGHVLGQLNQSYVIPDHITMEMSLQTFIYSIRTITS